jgi:basic amino acid/polyamine antiporter, APA family
VQGRDREAGRGYNGFLCHRNGRRFLGFKRALGPFDATMVVVGGIIGAGIFINPYIVAQRLDSPGLVLAAWIGGGLIAMAGALTFAELGSLFPTAGGHYAYLRDAYHPVFGFLYGWALLFMIEGGAIAAVAITFAEYTFRFLGRSGGPTAVLAILGIVIVTVVNYLGVRPGSRLLNTFVILKVAAIAVLIGAGLILPGASEGVGLVNGVTGVTGVTGATGAGVAAVPGTAAAGSGGAFSGLFLAMGAALIPIMFSYGGWQNANYLAEEIKDPVRNLPKSLLWGTAIVVLTYVLVNFVYLKTLGHAGLAGTLTPASDAANHLFGNVGDRLIALTIAVSTFGFLNLTMLAPTRVYYAMSRDNLFVPAVARIHPRYQTPSRAIVIQSAWAIVLVLTGTYADLVDYVVFADWIFFGLAGAAVFVFRHTHPVAERPEGSFTSPLYPFIPGLFVGVAILIVGSVLRSNPMGSVIGLGLLLTGIPAYLYWSQKS